jgi:DNA (cytosine-5)-methyltransferase 1
MSRDSGTRSGLLWEVERILKECGDNLPQVLFMENVPQVHGAKAIDDFREWLHFLESKGYVNFWKDLNAKDYGVAQNRNRTFMFSFLKSEFGEDVKYEFPQPMKLEKRLVDYLEDDVPDNMYVTSDKAQKLLEQLVTNGTIFNIIMDQK